MSGRGRIGGKGLGVHHLIMDPDAFASIVLRMISKENADRLSQTTDQWKTDPELQYHVYFYLKHLHAGDATHAGELIRDRLGVSPKARLTRKGLVEEAEEVVRSFDLTAYRFRPGGQIFQNTKKHWQQSRNLLQQHR